jgi:uncharacterized beta-barrel protein YwiB (DUF1934 family)
MIILKSTDTLEVLLAGAVATNQLPVVMCYVDIDTTSMEVTGYGNELNVTNNTTAVTIATAPASGKVRVIKKLNIRNKDTASVTLTLRIYNGSTRYEIWSGILSVDDVLQDDGQ